MHKSIFNKKAQFPIIKTFLIMFVTTVILVSFILLLNESSKISIDERKINQQLVINKIFNSKCFSPEFGVFEESLLNEQELQKCFDGLETGESNVLFRISMTNYKGNELLDYLYFDEKSFSDKKNLCGSKSNYLCSKVSYPVIYRDLDSNEIDAFLVIEILSFESFLSTNDTLLLLS